jgi:hypothetical protein
MGGEVAVAERERRGHRALGGDDGGQGGPLGLGYIRLPGEDRDSDGLIADGITVMEAFASRCCYRLGEVFVDDEPLRLLGWGSLVDAVRVVRPVAVLVPDLDRLRLPGSELGTLRAKLRHATSAPLVVARADLAWGAPDVAAVTVCGAPVSPRTAGALSAPRARSRRAGWRLSWEW